MQNHQIWCIQGTIQEVSNIWLAMFVMAFVNWKKATTLLNEQLLFP